MDLILLDRDGVINEDLKSSVRCSEEFRLLPRVGEAISLLNRAEIPAVVVTNQAVVGRGHITNADLQSIHDYMEDLLAQEDAYLTHILSCTSSDPDHFARKPNPGLLLEAIEIFQSIPEKTILIGDAVRDLEAAHRANCKYILVKTGRGKEVLEQGLPDHLVPLYVAEDLLDGVTYCLERFSQRS